jgi:hypothetical protein
MKKQSPRRLLVASRRLQYNDDVLKRRSERVPQWTYFEHWEHVRKNHQWALLSKRTFRRRLRHEAKAIKAREDDE